jgi:uncharacterized membrane protein YeiB
MTKRITGIDFARALAIIGMIIVNFKMVIGSEGGGWALDFAELFSGRAAALFVVLAGVGIGLMTRKAYESGDPALLSLARKRLFNRAAFLFVVGLTYYWIWPADILHFYGVYMLVTLLVIRWKPRAVLRLAVGLVLLFPLLLSIFNYESGWDFVSLDYLDFWTVEGFARNLFFNGFHPVVPWVAFMLLGLWFGRQRLNDDAFVWRVGLVATGVFAAVCLFSWGVQNVVLPSADLSAEDIKTIFGLEPMPPLPLYMINGGSLALAVTAACILLTRRWEASFPVRSLVGMGKLALTFYVAHVVIGMGLYEVFSGGPLGGATATFSVVYALLFSLGCWVFALLWGRYFRAGPLEWVMRKVTD